MLDRLDWRSCLNPSALLRGRGYAERGRVDQLRCVDALGLHWAARVQGSGSARYQCEVLVSEQGARARLRSVCTCPLGSQCKHVAAVLLVAEAGGTVVSTPSLPGFSARETATTGAETLLAAWDRWLQATARPAPATGNEIAQAAFRLVVQNPLDSGRKSLLVTMAQFLPGKQKAWLKPRSLGLNTAGTPTSAPTGGWREDDLMALAVLLPAQQVRADGLFFATIRGRPLECAFEHLLRRHGACLERIEAPLRLGQPRPLRVDWESLPDGNQRLRADVGEKALLLRGDGWWYLDPRDGEIGRVIDELGLADAAGRAPLLRPEHVVSVRQRLAAQPQALALPEPAERSAPRELRAAPRLSLRMAIFQPAPWRNYARELASIGYAHVRFDYAGELVDHEAGARVRRWRGTELLEIVRDLEAEGSAMQKLTRHGLRPAGDLPWPLRDTVTDLNPHHLLLLPGEQRLPQPPKAWLPLLFELGREGVLLSYEGEFPRPLRDIAVDSWDAELKPAENSWFELSLGVDIEGQRVDLLPILRRVLADRSFPLQPRPGEREGGVWRIDLDDERALLLPLARLRALVAPLLDWWTQDSAGLRVHRSQAAAVDALRGVVHWRGDDALRKRLVDLAGRARPAKAPPGFRGRLRAYQRDGLAWLDGLAEAGLGGLLADDMGLGKTVQILAHLLSQRAGSRGGMRTLVVAPTSLMGNWRDEAARFAPDLKVLVLQGADRGTRFDAISDHDLVLTTYPLLPRDRKLLLDHEFDLVVLDEAQAIKNAGSQAARVVRELRTKRRLAMTGTPVENHLGELWAHFDAVEPGLLGGARDFVRRFRTPIEKHGDAECQQRLNRRIGSLLLRRRKDEVLKDLPPKTEIIRHIEIEGGQRELYETLRLAQHERVREAISERGLAASGIVVLDALLKLRQACCDPRLVKLPAARKVQESAKLDALLELLDTLLDEGRSVLLFSQFTGMLDLLEPVLAKRKLDFLRLDGSTPAKTRTDLVQRFQKGEQRLFLISLKAGGVGLNLTAADAVIHYDPWWNPAAENQATDRAHRIGQNKPVFVYKLICQGTVEQKILELQGRKSALTRAILEGGRSTRLRFDEADLGELFAPLA